MHIFIISILYVYISSPTLTQLTEMFKKHNPKWSDIRSIMTDKDTAERTVITECLPAAQLMICMFHVVNIFNREITTIKMGISDSERIAVLELLSKMAYSHSKDEGASLYLQLQRVEGLYINFILLCVGNISINIGGPLKSSG